jgi:hypothetical protein
MVYSLASPLCTGWRKADHMASPGGTGTFLSYTMAASLVMRQVCLPLGTASLPHPTLEGGSNFRAQREQFGEAITSRNRYFATHHGTNCRYAIFRCCKASVCFHHDQPQRAARCRPAVVRLCIRAGPNRHIDEGGLYRRGRSGKSRSRGQIRPQCGPPHFLVRRRALIARYSPLPTMRCMETISFSAMS